MPVGGLCRIERIVVTSTFGDASTLVTGTGPGGWRAFELTGLPGYLPVLPTVSTTLDGPVVEEIAIARDEGANVAWAIERIIANPLGLPATAAASAPRPPPPTDTVLARYLPITAPPSTWRPLVRRGDRLVPAALRGVPPPPPARGHLLPTSTGLRNDVVPRDGVVLRRAWQAARTRAGVLRAWITRSLRSGAGELASGVVFDHTEPPGGNADT